MLNKLAIAVAVATVVASVACAQAPNANSPAPGTTDVGTPAQARGLASVPTSSTATIANSKVPSETLSQAEIYSLIQSLTAGHKAALIKVARVYAKKTSYGHEDLIQEAFMRVLDGRRGWPKNVAAVPFLCGVMRSIA